MPIITISDEGPVRSVVLSRPEDLNTITVQLRDELGEALDAAERDPAVRVVLLRAEGRAFCAGFALDDGIETHAHEDGDRVWDSVADLAMITPFANTWAKLHSLSKPTIAAVQGWCVAGGTDLVFNADLIIAGESARFGYPPSRAWGTPEAPWVWIARLGPERAKRFLFTGDEIPGPTAARLGLVLDCVADENLNNAAMDLAQRIGRLPLNQLQMLKLLCNQVTDQLYRPESSRVLGCLLDGVARHTQEGLDFVATARRHGPMAAVGERDAPFGDYGQSRTP